MSLARLLAHQSALAAAPDVDNPGWRLGVADNILEEIWERYGEGPVMSDRQRGYEMAYDNEMSVRNYLRANYERNDLLAVVAIDRAHGDRVQQFIKTTEEVQSPEFQRRLRAMNSQGSDIFISQNTLREGATGRTKADIKDVRHIFLDVDAKGVSVMNKIASELPPAHHVLESSVGKHQVIWSVSGMGITDAEATMRSMAAQFGGDPAATDASRVLRLPSFSNRKPEYAHLPLHWVRDVATVPAAKQEYSPSDFRMVIAPTMVRGIYANAGTQRAQAGVGTQSEKDWAYVMRGLEKGKQPAELIAHLEATRTDKPNPEYYARKTVEKAMQRFMLQRAPEQSVGVGIG